MRHPERHPTTVRCAYESPLGPMTLAATDRGLCGAWFDGQKHMPDTTRWAEQPDHPVLRQTRKELAEYFAGQRSQFTLALDLEQGTAFQREVWHGLLDISAGHTQAYGALGARIGRAAAVRAVGAAVGRNPVSIVVPCHRVVGANGSMTGYAGGLDRKRALLRLEAEMTATIKA